MSLVSSPIAKLLSAGVAVLTLAAAQAPAMARTAAPVEGLRRVTQPQAPGESAPKQPLLDPAARMAQRAPLTGMSFQAASSMPSLALSSSAVNLTLDAYGSFGRASAGGDAQFNDGSRVAPTVFECMAHVQGVGFLDSQSLVMPPSGAHPTREGNAVVASYVLGPWRIDVRSELVDCDQPHCAVLRQDWTLTNTWASPRDLVFTSYLDGDLFFAGDYANDWAARNGGTVYEFDDGSDPSSPSTFLGLTTEAPEALRAASEIGEYSEQRRRIYTGGFLADRAMRADGSSADRDADGVTDAGYDVTLASQQDFGSVPPGESVTVQVRVQWGVGSIDELGDPPVAYAGADQVVECAGPAGTPVLLDGTGSTPLADITTFSWLVDGVAVANGAQPEVVLTTGNHVVELTVMDSQGRSASDTAEVSVVDNVAPEVAVGAAVQLWPPDHRLVPVALPVSAADACAGSASLRVLQVTSDEEVEVSRGGDGHTGVDVLLLDGTLYLRRERQGAGDGRVYRVLVAADDRSGNTTLAEVEVHVPHAPGQAAVDSGVAETTVLE